MRQVFFSFHYNNDVWRAGQVRNMGVVDSSSTWSDNDWEQVRKTSSAAITRWINKEMDMRSCVVVLIGEETASRKWVKYEIEKAYERGKGIVGVYVHNLEDRDGQQSRKGRNPFDELKAADGKKLSAYVECYDSPYSNSNNVYNMASNSFMLKGWAVTIASAVLVLMDGDHTEFTILVILIPLLFFWALDSYYLKLERKYRKLYDRVRMQRETDFDMNISECPNERWAWYSKTEICFYLPLILIALIIFFVIRCR